MSIEGEARGPSDRDNEQFRERLRNMTDEEIRVCGRRLLVLTNPKTQGYSPNPAFVEQLKEARAEWRRRHPRLRAI
jgi:hypothetical protein